MDEEPEDFRETITIQGLKNGLWYCGTGDQEGHYFRMKKKYRPNGTQRNRIYLICVFQGCPARGNVDETANGFSFMRVTVPNHIHPANQDRERELIFLTQVLNRAARERTALKIIYDEVCLNFPSQIASQFPYNKVVNSMKRRRQRSQPKLPLTIERMAHILTTQVPQWGQTVDGGQFFAGYYENGILFISSRTKDLLGMEGILFTVDGTFKITPRKPKFYQLYTLRAVYGHVFIPIAFALLKNKEADTYRWMFDQIQRAYPEWNPTRVMTDFELGAIAALRAKFPNIELNGCWFHFSKAIQKKCGELGLIIPMRESPNLRNTIRKLMALALLPATDIVQGFLHIVNELRESRLLNDGTMKLLRYFRDYWIQRIGPEMFSVANSAVRTNNVHEAFHRNIMLHCKSARSEHPNVWRFLRALQITENDAYIKMLAARRGHDGRHWRDPRWVRQDEQIARTHQLYRERRIDIVSFLNRCLYFINFRETEEHEQ